MPHCPRLLLAAALAAPLCPASAFAEDVSAPAILQWFESSYQAQEHRLGDFFRAGYGGTWVPPVGRADSGNQSVGYDVYDRFDLGRANAPTLYGTETGLRTLTSSIHRVGGSLYVDQVLNHNGFSDQSRPGFVAGGGYPGFFLQNPDGGSDPFGVPGTDGDFHSPFESGELRGRLAGLIDINHATNFQFIRTPVNAGDPRNLPAGTSANRADPANARFYADRDLAPILVFNPRTGERDIAIHPFNASDPLAGDAVPENALGLLMRNSRWMIQDVGVDGFRLDAAKHFEPFVYDFFDQAVYRASTRTNLDGSRRDPFSFAEAFLTDTGELLGNHVRKDIDPNDPGRVGGNRDALDFNYQTALARNLQANAFGNDWRNVQASGVDVADDGLINGSSGLLFVQSHDEGPDQNGLAMSNVAHAHMLMRPGNAVVYFNAKEHGDGRDFPKDGRGDALGDFGDAITTLTKLRETHGRGDFRDRLTEKETHAYERAGSALVVLSNRNDPGFDTRRLDIDLPFGTPLVEYTGNAAADADIAELLIVDNDFFAGPSKVTVRALRNDGQDKGYLVYGLAKPESAGGIRLTGLSQTLGPEAVPLTVDADADGLPDAPSNRDRLRSRNAPLRVVTGDSLGVALETDAVTLTGGWLNPLTQRIDEIALRDRDADGDAALLRLDGGLDLNGSGAVDFVTPGDTAYGFERFVDVNDPGFFNADGRGRFAQTIDTTGLAEGEHFLTVRAFRHRDPSTGGDGGPAVFEDFKEVLYVDRLAPESALAGLTPFSADGHDIDFDGRSLDGTADSMHFFLNLGSDLSEAEVLAQVDGGNAGSAIDRDLFRRGFFDVKAGNNALTLVTFEVTGNRSVRRFSGIGIDNGNGAGIGDVDGNGSLTRADLTASASNFETFLYGRNRVFSPAADANGDGLVDTLDLLAIRPLFDAAAVTADAAAAFDEVLARRGNLNGSGDTDSFDLLFLRDNLSTTDADLLWTLDLNPDGLLDGVDAELFVTAFLGETSGDFTRDGVIDLGDTDAFVLALRDLDAYQRAFSIDALVTGDIDRDFSFGVGDIEPFLGLFGDDRLARQRFVDAGFLIPEPGTAAALLAGLALLTRRRASSPATWLAG